MGYRPAWAGYWGRGGGRAITRAIAKLPTSGAAGRVVTAALFRPSDNIVVIGALVATEGFTDKAAPPAWQGSLGRFGYLHATENSVDVASGSGFIQTFGSLAATDRGGDKFRSPFSNSALLAGYFAKGTRSNIPLFAGKLPGQRGKRPLLDAAFTPPGRARFWNSVLVKGALAPTEAKDHWVNNGLGRPVVGAWRSTEAPDVTSITVRVLVKGTLAVTEGYRDSFAGSGVRNTTFTITPAQALLLQQVYRLHGLMGAVAVSDTQRSAMGFTQTVNEVDGVVSVSGNTPTTTFSGVIGTMIEELAAIHGVTGTLQVSATARTNGALTQTISRSAGVTTIARA